MPGRFVGRRGVAAVVREDHLLVGGLALLGVVVALLVGVLRPPSYTSTSVLYVASSPAASTSADGSSGGSGPAPEVRANSYAQLLTGIRVATDASALLGGTPSPDEIRSSVSAEAVPGTVVLDIAVTARTPEQTRSVALAVVTAASRLVGTVESADRPANRPGATVQVISAPTLPAAPSGLGLPALAGIGLAVGFVLGIGAALARRWPRRSIGTGDRLAARAGAPVLATIPALARRPRRPAVLSGPPTGTGGGPGLRARAEAVRRLRTAMRGAAGDPRCLLVTGAASGQATSTTASDLAIALALSGESVVLVEADLRRPVFAYAFGLDAGQGVGDVLSGRRELDAALQQWSPGHIDVLPAGLSVEQPAELLGSEPFRELLQGLRSRYDRVLIDAAPITAAAETLEVARHADGALLVCRRGGARPPEVDAAVAALRMADVPLVGLVLTFAVDVPDAPVDTRLAASRGHAEVDEVAEVDDDAEPEGEVDAPAADHESRVATPTRTATSGEARRSHAADENGSTAADENGSTAADENGWTTAGTRSHSDGQEATAP